MSANTQAFRENRARFPIEELLSHDGKWVAFSADGSRIVAAAATLTELDRRIVAAGEDPEECGLERIEFDDCPLGGADVI